MDLYFECLYKNQLSTYVSMRSHTIIWSAKAVNSDIHRNNEAMDLNDTFGAAIQTLPGYM